MYSTDADPRTMALIDRRRRRQRARRAATTDGAHELMEAAADGPQDPLRHDRPAALRHARLQRRHARPHAGRRRARRARASATSGPHPQSVVCMPSRSTMLTGQHPSTHGVWMNGVPLPVDAPSVAAVLHDAGYRTALVGKAHFEPFLDPFGRFDRERASPRRTTAPARTAASSTSSSPTHGAAGPLHYARWLATNHPEAVGMFYPVLDADLRGQRGRRRRDRRAAGARQPDPARAGTTPTGSPTARSPGSTRSAPTTTGSAG